jgi:hypothetical protein
MNVRAYHHIPENRGISVIAPTQIEDFVLEATLANILVISDGVAREEEHKVATDGTVLEIYSGISDDIESASQIATDLVALGYDVTEETAAGSDPSLGLGRQHLAGGGWCLPCGARELRSRGWEAAH